MALSNLLRLLPLAAFCCCLLSNAQLAAPKFGRIPEAEVEADMKAVDQAIQTPWVELNPSGVQRAETKRESLALSDAQKALFNRHWELETIQRERPTAPKQLDMEMLAEALDVAVEMDEEKKAIQLRMDRLGQWAAEGQGEAEELKEAGGKSNQQLTNLIGTEGEEAATTAEEEPPQCAEADKPAMDGSQRQVEIGELERNGIEQAAPSVAILEMEPMPSVFKTVGSDGQPVVLVMMPTNNSGGRPRGPEGRAENMEVNHEGGAVGNGGKGEMDAGVDHQQDVDVAQEEKEAAEEGGPVKGEGGGEIVTKPDEQVVPQGKEDAKGDEGRVEEEEGVGGKKEEEGGEKDAKKMEEEVKKKDEEGKKSISREADEKTVFDTIQLQKEGEEASKRSPGGVLIIDWAKGAEGSGDEEEEEEEDGAAIQKVAKMRMLPEIVGQQEEESSSESVEVVKPVEIEVVRQKEGEEDERQNNGGFWGALSRLLLGRSKREVGGRFKRDVLLLEPVPMPSNFPEEQTPSSANQTMPVNDGQNGEVDTNKKMKTVTMVRSFMGRLAMGNGLGIAAKWEMTTMREVPKEGEEKGEDKGKKDEERKVNEEEGKKEEEKAEEDVGNANEDEKKDEKKGEEGEAAESESVVPEQQGNGAEGDTPSGDVAEGTDENAVVGQPSVHILGNGTIIGENCTATGNGVPNKIAQEKAELVQYLEEYVAKTGGPKQAEKLAYIWYSELQYWLAKHVEMDFGGGGGGKNVGQVLDEKEGMKGEELAYMRVKWATTVAKLSKLTRWIGKDFRRRR